jgi:hypothetical protein
MAHEHRNLERRLVHQPLVEHAVIAEKEAVVGCVDDERVLAETFAVEEIEHAPNILVDSHEHAIIILDEEIVIAPRAFFERHVGADAAIVNAPALPRKPPAMHDTAMRRPPDTLRDDTRDDLRFERARTCASQWTGLERRPMAPARLRSCLTRQDVEIADYH